MQATKSKKGKPKKKKTVKKDDRSWVPKFQDESDSNDESSTPAQERWSPIETRSKKRRNNSVSFSDVKPLEITDITPPSSPKPAPESEKTEKTPEKEIVIDIPPPKESKQENSWAPTEKLDSLLEEENDAVHLPGLKKVN
jgi:hypothetical protein